MSEKAVKLYVDGGVIGKNPSTVGVYWSVGKDEPDGSCTLLTERKESRAHFTNNEAEYLALLDGLEHVAAMEDIQAAVIHSDSQLIVQQFNGHWKIGKPELAKLCRQAQQNATFLFNSGVTVAVTWVGRKENVKRLGH